MSEDSAVLGEIRDLLQKILAAVTRAPEQRSTFPPSVLPTSAATGDPRSVACPYCKSGVGQPCSNDPSELPIRFQDGCLYHSSRMRLAGLWPPR